MKKIIVAVAVIIAGLCVFLVISVAWLITREEPVALDTVAAQGITYTDPVALVPGPGMPDDITIHQSNNNLDIIQYDGRFFLAFRTAPVHFASTRTLIHIVSSPDRKRWTHEATFNFQSDLREPRFVAFNGTLLFYFFKAGETIYKFEPQHIYASERRPDASWTRAVPVWEPGYVVWRVKNRHGRLYMAVYDGGKPYTDPWSPGDCRLLTSDDGYTWAPISDRPQTDEFTASEMAFEFDEAGGLVAVVRMELQGGLVCTAPRDDIATWECRKSLYKYDSSLMFRRGDTFYLIARRNVAGPYLRYTPWLGDKGMRIFSLVRYSLTRKRTSLYIIDVARKELRPLFDFPSRGDTAFAGIAPLDANTYWVANYTSPLDGPDYPWIAGQISNAVIYGTELSFP